MKLVIPSCYSYRQCWAPWLAFQKRYWPECPYEKWLLTDTPHHFPLDGCFLAKIHDAGFCENLLGWCKRYGAGSFVFVMLDDHWICGEVDNHRLRFAEALMREHDDVGCFRLHPSPGPQCVTEDWYGVSEIHTAYRISTAPSIWRVSYLRKLLEIMQREKLSDTDCGFRYSTAGYFEIVGSLMSLHFPDVILASSVPVVPFINSAIVKGRWDRRAIEEAEKIGVAVDTGGRGFRP